MPALSAAAKQLRLGQPAVSKTIAQLGERLGVRLLLRSTHGLTPTEAGRSFYERAKRSIDEADEAEFAARCGHDFVGASAHLRGGHVCAASRHTASSPFLGRAPRPRRRCLSHRPNKDL